jgi:hypothetical protein
MYIIGIGLNAIALVYSVVDGSPLFAVTFALVIAYLGVRYWMIATGRGPGQ